jgi:hypothetical protein
MINKINFLTGLSLISCNEVHIHFTFKWVEVLKDIGFILLGAFIVIGIIVYIFRNFRIY